MEFPRSLVGEQVGMLRNALVDAFPRHGMLAQMVRVRLDENIEGIVANEDLRTTAFRLIEWAASSGRLEALVRGALAEVPGNPSLRGFAVSIGYRTDDRGALMLDELSTLYLRRSVAVDGDQRALDDEISRTRAARRKGPRFVVGEHLGSDGRYRLVQELGRGGFGSVWDAWDIKLKRHVAVKVLHGHLSGDETRLARFESGARKMQRLEHPGIVQVLAESQQWEEFHYFVMRFIPGGDLKDAVLAGWIDAAKGIELIAKVGEALVYSHSQGVVHGDVKPANVLLTESLEPKLTDFDLAQGNDSTTHTARGAGMGSALYTAPEVLHEAGVANERADVFALGCTALFVLLGREFKVAEWSRPAIPLRDVRCSRHAKVAIARAMNHDPAQRFPTMRQFVDALTSVEVADPAVDPLVGCMIADGRYHVVRVLGEGGSGKVYQGEQRLGNSVRPVAIKTLRSDLDDPQIVARFLREMGILSRLEHPNIIRLYESGRLDDGQYFAAIELLRGESVAYLIARGPVAPTRVVRILAQLCDALSEVHGLGIVHRDVKPDNVILTQRGQDADSVKLMDFGIAKYDVPPDEDSAKLTRQGMVLGTPPYMSPEQFTGQPLKPSSDIYALAVMTYEMLTGQLPFEASTPWEWATKHLTAPPIPFEAHPSSAHVTPQQKAAVMRALSKEARQRPQTARDFLAEFFS